MAKGLGLGLLCWGFKGVQEEIPREEASTLQIGSVAFPPVHNSILLTDYLTKMGIKTVPQFLNWEDERGCDEGHWHTHTRGLLWGLPEVVGTVQQVHWSRRRLLRRGLEFHVCTINKSAHTKSLENYRMHLVYQQNVVSKGNRLQWNDYSTSKKAGSKSRDDLIDLWYIRY